MISAEKATGFPVSVACALLGVSRSAFYDWERGAPSDRELTDAWLLETIKEIHATHRGVYGRRRSTPSCASPTTCACPASGCGG
jgi:putative transposase